MTLTKGPRGTAPEGMAGIPEEVPWPEGMARIPDEPWEGPQPEGPQPGSQEGSPLEANRPKLSSFSHAWLMNKGSMSHFCVMTLMTMTSTLSPWRV